MFLLLGLLLLDCIHLIVLVFLFCVCFFFFKQKTAYEMRISDWSSDVCSSDLLHECLVDARLDVETRRGGADLPGIAEFKGGAHLRREVDIGIVRDDEG